MADKSHVFLSVLDFGGDPTVVTARIGLPPSSSWRQGDTWPSRPTAFHQRSGWTFKSPLPLEAHVEEHLTAILPLLEPQVSNIRQCAAEFSVMLSCAIYYEDFSPGIQLSPEILRRVSALGVALDLDLYFLGDGSQPPKNV